MYIKGKRMTQVKLSVRALVEFILREGDIDNRRTHMSDNAMQEGGRLHRKIQKSMGSEYHSEVPLSYTFVTGDGEIEITIDGRADGIIEGDTVTIDEIKGTYRKLDKMESPDGVHLAQAKCYAYMYATDLGLDSINVQMTYCNMDTEDIKRFTYSYSYSEVEEWFIGVIKAYEKWAVMENEWNNTRNLSIKQLEFPFEYRDGQKELVTHVYHTIVHGRKLFLEAPTGAGKTIATVFPTIKALGEGKAERMFYLTAKTITRTVACDAIAKLRDKALRLKSVVITAKEKICLMEEPDCNPEYCSYAKGHFDRVNEALFAILNEREDYSREVILEYAQKYTVCPFEFCLDISLFCDAIICDYNYLFDPHVYLKRFFAEGKGNNNIFLIDEAHNLVDRGRAMYSAKLVKEDFLTLKRKVQVYDEKLAKRLEKCNHELLLLKRECTDVMKTDSLDIFVRALERLYSAMESYLENHESSPVRDDVLDMYFEISHFLYIYELIDEKYVIYCYFEKNANFAVRLFCVDPSKNLEECMKRGKSSILFSATLLPIRYYKGLLGGDDNDYEVYANSTFDISKRGLYICDNVTSKYSMRSNKQYDLIAEYIHHICCSKVGNYMVFLPSYSFMQEVWTAYNCKYDEDDNFQVLLQDESMSEEKKEEFLAAFEESSDKGHVAFCVLGGIFSEGIDLQHDRLIGAIVVGTGIPMVCTENELIKEYFDNRDEDGMQYAYIYPGFNKVLQAVGRVIRTADDVGVVALLDYRFRYSGYKNLYPREWSNIRLTDMEKIDEDLGKFWGSNNLKGE